MGRSHEALRWIACRTDVLVNVASMVTNEELTENLGYPNSASDFALVYSLPAEVHAKVIIEPLVMWLEVLLQPAPSLRVHPLLVAA